MVPSIARVSNFGHCTSKVCGTITCSVISGEIFSWLLECKLRVGTSSSYHSRAFKRLNSKARARDTIVKHFTWHLGSILRISYVSVQWRQYCLPSPDFSRLHPTLKLGKWNVWGAGRSTRTLLGSEFQTSVASWLSTWKVVSDFPLFTRLCSEMSVRKLYVFKLVGKT